MISQILTFLAQFWRQLLAWYILPAEFVGFVRRLGRPHRDATPGIHWKWPVLEVLESEDGRDYAVVTDPQSLICKDGAAVVVRFTVVCRVVNARKYLLEVCDGRGNVQDLVVGEAAWLIQRRMSSIVLSGQMIPDLERRVAKATRKWGINTESIRLLDCARARSVRLWSSNLTSSGQE